MYHNSINKDNNKFNYRSFFLGITLFLVSLTMGTRLIAQKQTNWWYFGIHAGLNFNKITNGLPEVLDNGGIDSFEANATLSDENGNLLFYTDGRYVFDALHDTMPNGTGLLGERTTSQCIIVPNPGNPEKYYLFYINYFSQTPGKGFCYAEVDLSLRGGLGDVVTSTKNTGLADGISERITAVKMAGKNGYWVIVHKFRENNNPSNAYLVYEVTPSGVNPVPVISRLGPWPNGGDFTGELKASPCGDQVATTFRSSAIVSLMDFDAFTGRLSNARMHVRVSSEPWYKYLGIEFSEDGGQLYVSLLGDKTPDKIRQYSTAVSTSLAFENSMVALTDGKLNTMRGMQRGPDGKIYFIYGNTNQMGVIHNPNLPGTACNMDPNGPVIPSGKASLSSSFNLPNFMSSFFCPEISIASKYYCFDEQTAIWLTGGTGKIQALDSVHFHYGDPNSTDNFSNQLSDVHRYSGTGPFDVRAVVFTTYKGRTLRDTLSQTIEIHDAPISFLGPDTTLCIGDTLLLTPHPKGKTTIWNSAQQEVTSLHKAGVYYGKTELNGCRGTDTLVIDTLPVPVVDLGPDTALCNHSMVLAPLNLNPNYTYQWDDGLTEAQQTVTVPGSYTLTATGQCGTASDEIQVEDCGCNGVEFPNVFTPNGDGKNDVFRPISHCNATFYQFTVYNRWGAPMFHSEQEAPLWSGAFNGKKCTDGVYFWLVEYQKENGQHETQKGSLTLLGN